MKVKECMCNKVICVCPQDTLSNIAKVMQSNHIGCVPVCDNEKICGIITDRDIVLRAIANNKDVESTMASEVMTTNLYTCMQDDEITNAQKKMECNQVRRLPVCDNTNRVVGILTLGNLVNNNELSQNNVTTTIENICNCEGNIKNGE